MDDILVLQELAALRLWSPACISIDTKPINCPDAVKLKNTVRPYLRNDKNTVETFGQIRYILTAI